MIKVSLVKDKNTDQTIGFTALGHANYAGPGETDEVCAGVTALAGALVVSLTDLLDLEVKYDFTEGNLGCLVKDLPADKEAEADLLFRSFEMGCKQIEYSYGKDYVEVASEPLEMN